MAEPGLLFWDNILNESPADCYKQDGFGTVSTNPCSELPLCELDSCRLMLINLYTYVKQPFTNDAYFDYYEFYNDCKIMQRLMDDMVDLEIEHIERIIDKIISDPEPQDVKQNELRLWKEIKQKCVNGRRTGSGITALGDTFAALNIRYGSPESINETDKIYKTLKLACYQSSVDMAKELGPFPIWNHSLEKDNVFLKRLKHDKLRLIDERYEQRLKNQEIYTSAMWPQEFDGNDLYNNMQKYGRRNIALLTTAPAGTVSTLTQTTSGIEPAFMLEYKRRKKITHDSDAKADFVDQSGDKWQVFSIFHHKVLEWMKITGETDLQKSPWYMSCAEDLDWADRVMLQSKAQRHIEHGISSTLNLPEQATEQDVATIYEKAWELGLKGITVYRKNCRTGVLVDNKTRVQKTNAPKRPKTLECDVHFVLFDKLEYFVIVGLFEKEPYEVFIGNNITDLPDHDLIDRHIKRNVKNGLLRKNKRGHYSLIDTDHHVICDNIADKCDNEEEAIARLISISLRHGSDIAFITHQLEKIKGDLNSLARGIARVLKKYITNGIKVSGEECGQCGAIVIRQEGCITCKSCGWSKCA
jgi:ribonucleoside-diphosphate reductase alpha chain